MRTSRKLFVASALTAAAALTTAPATTPASAVSVNGPGAGVLHLVYTYDTPIPPGGCIDTTFTVDGTIEGTLVMGTQLLRGTFDVAGTSAPSPIQLCHSANSGEMFFWGTVNGTDADGHVLDCEVGSVIERIDFYNNPGGMRGYCTVDGVDAGELSIGGEGVSFSQPPEAGLLFNETATGSEVYTQYTQKVIVTP